MDKTFLGGIGQERNEAESWFELLARAGVIFKKVRLILRRQITDQYMAALRIARRNQSASETDLRPAESQHDAKSPCHRHRPLQSNRE